MSEISGKKLLAAYQDARAARPFQYAFEAAVENKTVSRAELNYAVGLATRDGQVSTFEAAALAQGWEKVKKQASPAAAEYWAKTAAKLKLDDPALKKVAVPKASVAVQYPEIKGELKAFYKSIPGRPMGGDPMDFSNFTQGGKTYAAVEYNGDGQRWIGIGTKAGELLYSVHDMDV